MWRNPEVIPYLIPGILIGLVFHEWAHGYVAYRFGDPTAKRMGRLTLNPLAHLDPIGTLVIFFIGFGWAKPVPVDYRNLRNPRQDMFWISAAGPLMNILITITAGIVAMILLATGVMGQTGSSTATTLFTIFMYMIYINVALAVFNLLPVPPLDGSKLLYSLLPPQYNHVIHFMETRGPMILFGILLFGYVTGFHIFGYIIYPIAGSVVNFFMG